MKKTYTVLIIDDERLARVRLIKLVNEFPDVFKIIGEAKNGRQAKQLIDDLKPDIIFLDIEMPGLTGFELLTQLENIPMVIFCTAYEEYSLKAFETNSIDYLIKPVKKERLLQTVLKLEKLKTNFSKENVLNAMDIISKYKEKEHITSITVKKKDTIIFVKLEDICCFEATDKCVVVHTTSGTEIIEQSLTQLEKKLPNNFLRVHRGYLLNTNYVKNFQKYFNNRYIITLLDTQKTTITSGRTYKDTIKKFINQ